MRDYTDFTPIQVEPGYITITGYNTRRKRQADSIEASGLVYITPDKVHTGLYNKLLTFRDEAILYDDKRLVTALKGVRIDLFYDLRKRDIIIQVKEPYEKTAGFIRKLTKKSVA